MRTISKLAFPLLVILPACVVALLAASYLLGMRFNVSQSLPKGIYWLTRQEARRGDCVIVAVGGEHLLKKVAGVPGDIITINEEGVFVNGAWQRNSAPILQTYFHLDRHHLPDGEVLVLSDYTPRSFDGRYFGPVSTGNISCSLVPLITW